MVIPIPSREIRFYNLEMLFSRWLTAALMTGVAAGLSAPAAGAEPEPAPIVHNVKYTITTDQPANVQIWFLDAEPPDEFAWSRDSYSFARNYFVPFATETEWTWELPMVNPQNWAWVSGSVDMLNPPTINCELSIDGIVVVQKSGDRGVLCSIRTW